MSRRANNLQESNYPLVNVQRFHSLKCEVNTRQLEELGNYISYVESATGDQPSEVKLSARHSPRFSSSIAAFKNQGPIPETREEFTQSE